MLSTTPNDHDVYICTTEEKKNKRLQDMNKISIQSSSFEKVKEFKPLEIVAVEIDGKWYYILCTYFILSPFSLQSFGSIFYSG